MPKKSCGNASQLAATAEAVTVLRDGFKFVISALYPGVTERQIARQLRGYFRARGHKHWAFRFIVAFGPSSADPHHWPTSRRLKTGQFVKIDMGLKIRGWKSDVTRTFIFGQATARQRRIYSLVLQAQKRALAALRAGVFGRDVDAAARTFLKRKGYGKTFVHSTGHGLGRAIHQPPWLSPKKGNRLLRAGEVVTVEPGIYIKSYGGVRIEDMALVLPRGARVLSAGIPK